MENKIRESNFELLRIITMFMVLIIHADFLATGSPTIDEISIFPEKSFVKFLIEALTIIAVNVFVLISGWFGIRPKLSSFIKLFFQVAFINAICVVVLSLTGEKIPLNDAIKNIVMADESQWFVKIYMLLFLLSPVLNKYVETASKKEFWIMLVSYLSFQTIFGWYFRTIAELSYGYSLASFIMLYLIGRFLNIHAKNLRCRFIAPKYWGGYLFLSLIISVIAFSRIPLRGYAYSYTSPFVIMSSIAFLLAFSKMKFSNNAVNWIASSCFAVYLLHMNKFVAPRYLHLLNLLYQNNSFSHYCLYAFVISIGVFVISILIDKVRYTFFLTIVALWKKFVAT